VNLLRDAFWGAVAGLVVSIVGVVGTALFTVISTGDETTAGAFPILLILVAPCGVVLGAVLGPLVFYIKRKVRNKEKVEDEPESEE